MTRKFVMRPCSCYTISTVNKCRVDTTPDYADRQEVYNMSDIIKNAEIEVVETAAAEPKLPKFSDVIKTAA